MNVEIDPKNIVTGKVDQEGRKFLDRDLAGHEVSVVILEDHGPADEN